MGYEPTELCENKKVLGNERFLIDAERSGHRREEEEEGKEEDGESKGKKEDENRGTGPWRVPRKIRENFRRAGTLSSWYSNTQVAGSMHRKKVKQRSAMNGIGY